MADRTADLALREPRTIAGTLALAGAGMGALLMLVALALAGWVHVNVPASVHAGERVAHDLSVSVHVIGATTCHAPTEDSVMTDCDYRDGGWHSER